MSIQNAPQTRCVLSSEQLCKELSGIGFFAFCNLFGCSFGNYRSAAGAALRTEVDYMIGSFDDIEIMLYHYDGVSVFAEP